MNTSTHVQNTDQYQGMYWPTFTVSNTIPTCNFLGKPFDWMREKISANHMLKLGILKQNIWYLYRMMIMVSGYLALFSYIIIYVWKIFMYNNYQKKKFMPNNEKI